MDDLDAIQWGDKPRKTFDELALRFMDLHLPTLKPQSARRYKISLKALTPHFEGLFLDRIGTEKLSEFEMARRREVTTSTIRRDLSCLSSMFSCARDWDWCDKNPVPTFLKARQKRGLREAPPRTRYLSHDEETALLGACTAYLRPLVEFAIDTGLRLEEQLSLTVGQVDFARKEVRVFDTKNHEPRTVPLLPRSFSIAQDRAQSNGPWLFTKSTGTRYFKLTRGLAAAAERAGIRDLKWHDLRRTCGCRLLQDYGLSIYEVSRWLGHKTVTQTERAYAFLGVDQLHRALEPRTISGTKHAESDAGENGAGSQDVEM